MHNTVVS